MYRARNKGMQILLSNSQAGPGRTVKQEQEEIAHNHVQAFIPGSVQGWAKEWSLGCVNSRPVYRGSQEARFTQPREHSLYKMYISVQDM